MKAAVEVQPTTTPFLRLDARNAWGTAAAGAEEAAEGISAHNVETGADVLRLSRRGPRELPLAEPHGSLGGLTLPKGVAVDVQGRIFVLSRAQSTVLMLTDMEASSFGRQQPSFRPLWTAKEDSYRLEDPRDLALSRRGDLVVADAARRRVIAYTWPELRVRHLLELPGTLPVAVAVDSQNRLHVADEEGQRILRFSSAWEPDADYGGPPDLGVVTRLWIDAEDRLFALSHVSGESPQRAVLLVSKDGHQTESLRDDLHRRMLESAGLPFPFERAPDGRLFRRRRLQEPPLALPPSVRVDERGRLLAGDEALQLTVPKPALSLRRSGALMVRIEGQTPRFPWHRVTFDVALPERTRLAVRTFTSDVERPMATVRQLPSGAWSRPVDISPPDVGALPTSPELLIQSPPGRFLWLYVELLGDGKHTPELSAIQVHAPRQSSLRWLPPPFHQDAESAHFLDRFLSYFDTVYAEIEHQAAHFARQLDPYASSGEFLNWLGRWFDWRFLPAWDEPMRRKMVAGAVELFRQRGTVNGLRQMLEWHTGLDARQVAILEHFRLEAYERHCALRQEPFIGGRRVDLREQTAHRFMVVVPAAVVRSPDEEADLRRVIDAQRPAHTQYELRLVKPGIRIGCQSTVGVDTWLGAAAVERLGGGRLGVASLAPSRANGIVVGRDTLVGGRLKTTRERRRRGGTGGETGNRGAVEPR